MFGDLALIERLDLVLLSVVKACGFEALAVSEWRLPSFRIVVAARAEQMRRALACLLKARQFKHTDEGVITAMTKDFAQAVRLLKDDS